MLVASACDDGDGPIASDGSATTGTETGGAGRPPVGDGNGGIALERIGEFDEPLYVTQPPTGDRGHLYVVERCGAIQRVPIAGGAAETFLDIAENVECGGTEQGLLSVAFAPDYRASGVLYVYYTGADLNQHVVEYGASPDGSAVDPASAREVLAMDDFASNHNGGLLLFGPDGRLWIGTGDGGGAGDPERNGQDLSSLLGKLLRIDADAPDARPEIAVYGLRNPWRFSFDRQTGDLWIGDVGQNELEEIDSVAAKDLTGQGEAINFGWSAFEGTRRFNEDQSAPGARPPVLEYPLDDACAVTGGYVVRDPRLRTLYGRYLYGDFCRGQLRSFTARAGARAADDRELGVEVASLSSFGEDLEGHVYATSLEGPVYRLVPNGG